MDQITVCFPPETLAFLKRTAEREFRTVGAQIRFMIEDAARRASSAPPTPAKPVQREPWPPPMPVVNKETLPEVKKQLAEWDAELARLDISEARSPLQFLPHHQDRQAFLRGRCESVRSHVGAIERLMGVSNG